MFRKYHVILILTVFVFQKVKACKIRNAPLTKSRNSNINFYLLPHTHTCSRAQQKLSLVQEYILQFLARHGVYFIQYLTVQLLYELRRVSLWPSITLKDHFTFLANIHLLYVTDRGGPRMVFLLSRRFGPAKCMQEARKTLQEICIPL